MKKSLIFLFYILPVVLMAQSIDRTKAPAPAPAPVIKVGKPVVYTLANGLKVFVVENNKLPRVSVTLTIDRDPILEGDKAGLVSMAGSLLRRGTTTMNKEMLDEEIDYLGASINTSATSVNASSLIANFSKAVALMSAITLTPSLPSDELEKIRTQELSGLQAAKDDPASISNNVVSVLTYGKNHPYGEIITEESLKKVTVADVKKYFDTYWKPNIAYLVFVGNITPAEAKALAEKNFAKWKSGAVAKSNYAQPAPPAKTAIAIVDRPASVQSLITLVAPVALKPGSPDAIPSSVMNNILGGSFSGRLFASLREKLGFTYGAYSELSPDKFVGSFSADASVRNEKTDSAVGAFLAEFERIRTEALTADEVSRMKNYLSGSFARSLESPSTIANFALNVARYNLPANYYQDYLKNLSLVSPQLVQAMAKKFVQPGQLNIVIVGNAKEIAKGLDKYGKVTYYDSYGNERAAPVVKTLDGAVTPQSILQKAIDAAGGAAAIASIKDIELNGEASIMGQAITIKQQNIFPGTFAFSAGVAGMVLQKQLLKGGVYTVTQQGATQEIDDQAKEDMNEKAYLVAEEYMLKQSGYVYALKGIEQVDGKDAYAVGVKTTAGREYTNYYDVASGLKVKASTSQDAGPMGKVNVQTTFAYYKPFNGVQIPTRVIIDLGQFKQDITFKDIKVNTGLKEADIK